MNYLKEQGFEYITMDSDFKPSGYYIDDNINKVYFDSKLYDDDTVLMLDMKCYTTGDSSIKSFKLN